MSQYLQLGTFDLTGKVYGEIKPTGGAWKVKQDGATTLKTGARRDSPDGSSYAFSVVFDDGDDASDFLAYCYQYSLDNPDFDEGEGADINLYIRTDEWFFNVWGVVVKANSLNKSPIDYIQYTYDVICYLYSPYSQYRRPGTWTQNTITSLPQTKSINNRHGHLAGALDELSVTCRYNAAHVKNLVHSITSSGGVTESITIADEALSDEVWVMHGKDYTLYETYEDVIASGTKWGHDWTGNGTFDTNVIKLNNGESAYIHLSGPHKVNKPIHMTADLSLDSGGATDEATVDVSPDGVQWETVLDQDDFESGDYEYVLQEPMYMDDAYVRMSCASGTSGKYLRIGYIKFEVERWIEYGTVPQIAASQTATATVDATTGSESVDIYAEFYPRRLFV